ncbi:MAG: hypothetical protein QOH38_836 [Thermoleophilaceae bacterium]|nr:hypothetical protein [Thermoleophilaceae bacterium]MEA2368118.1 hypothetical protein [Thermoleophilaceae bacterium]
MPSLHSTRWHALVVAGVLAAAAGMLGLAQLTRAQTNRTREVQRVVKTYEAALMSGHGDQACAQLTPEAKRQMVRSAIAAGVGSDCRQVSLAAMRYVDGLIAQAPSAARAAEVRRTVADPPVQILAIDADSATARIRETTGNTLHLVRGDDGWRISELSFPAGG